MEDAPVCGSNLMVHTAFRLRAANDFIFELLKNRDYVDALDSHRITVLHLACKYRRGKVLYKILSLGVEINQRDIFGRTALHYAVTANSIQFVLVLISKGADINAPDRIGQTPLFYACQFKREKIILLLLHYAADIEYRNAKGESVLLQLCSAKKGNFIEIIKLLIVMNADIFAKNKSGETVFQCAIKNDLDEIILLLSSIKNNPTDNELLFDDIIKNLNLNFNQLNQWNESFLHTICSDYRTNNKKVIPWSSFMDENFNGLVSFINMFVLLDENVEVQKKYTENKTPVCKTYQIIKVLLKTCNIDVNAKNYLGETALHLLCAKTIDTKEFTKCLEFLIKNGADLNITDNFKVTPLQYAIVKENIKYVDIMLKNGADARYNCLPNVEAVSTYPSNKIAFLKHYVYVAVNSYNDKLLTLCVILEICDNLDNILLYFKTFYETYGIILRRIILENRSILMPGLFNGLSLSVMHGINKFHVNLNYASSGFQNFFYKLSRSVKLSKFTTLIALFIMGRNGSANFQQHFSDVMLLPVYGRSIVFKELRRLNELKFDNTVTTVLQFLLANQNKSAALLENENILTQLSTESFLENNAPIYCDFLKGKLRESFKRKTLLNDAAKRILELIPEQSRLDAVPLKYICRMLNNFTLKQLIECM